MQQGLVQGLQQGLLGFDGKWGPAAALVLADFNFATPLTSWKTGFTGFSSPVATDEWLMQESSSPYANTGTGSETLADSAGLVNQTCTPVYDGTGYSNRKAWECLLVTAKCTASGTTALNPTDSDLCIRTVFCGINTATTKGLFSNRNAFGEGYALVQTTNGTLALTVEDANGNLITVTLTKNHFDGALHYVSIFYDEGAKTLELKSDLGTTGAVDASILDSSIQSAVAFRLGDPVSGAAVISTHFTYVGGCAGANAATMHAEDFWQHGQDPSGLLTTTSRASLVSVPVSATTVGHFAAGTALGTTQLPIGYNANFSDTYKLGLYCNSAVTNLVPESEVAASGTLWNVSDSTLTPVDADAPDGFRSAATVLATAADGVIWDGFLATVSTEYTASAWVRRSGGSDVAGKISYWDPTTGHTQQAFTATADWQRVQVTATQDGVSTTARMYLWVDTNTEAIEVWGMQTNLGDGRGAYIRTAGASAALVYSDYQTLGDAGEFIKNSKGEASVTWVTAFPTSPNTNGYLFDGFVGAGNTNRVYLNATSGGRRPTSVGYNSSAGSEWTVTKGAASDLSTQENTAVVQWDSTGGLAVAAGAEASMVYLAESADNDIGSYTATDTATKVVIGNWRVASGAGCPDAFIQRIRIWDKERI